MGGNRGLANTERRASGRGEQMGDDRASEDRRWYVTFGPGHRRAEPIEITYQGWVEVLAPAEMEARRMVMAELGRRWSFIYAEKDFEPKWYPLGRLATLTRRGFEGITYAHVPPSRPA